MHGRVYTASPDIGNTIRGSASWGSGERESDEEMRRKEGREATEKKERKKEREEPSLRRAYTLRERDRNFPSGISLPRKAQVKRFRPAFFYNGGDGGGGYFSTAASARSVVVETSLHWIRYYSYDETRKTNGQTDGQTVVRSFV